MKTVKAEWLDYAASVLHPASPEIQRTECRRAFCAGAHAMMSMLIETAFISKTNTRVMALQNELDVFAQDVVDGKA